MYSIDFGTTLNTEQGIYEIMPFCIGRMHITDDVWCSNAIEPDTALENGLWVKVFEVTPESKAALLQAYDSIYLEWHVYGKNEVLLSFAQKYSDLWRRWQDKDDFFEKPIQWETFYA